MASQNYRRCRNSNALMRVLYVRLCVGICTIVQFTRILCHFISLCCPARFTGSAMRTNAACIWRATRPATFLSVLYLNLTVLYLKLGHSPSRPVSARHAQRAECIRAPLKLDHPGRRQTRRCSPSAVPGPPFAPCSRVGRARLAER